MKSRSWAVTVAALFSVLINAYSQSVLAACDSRAFNRNEDQVVNAYIAYYGRPADTGGLAYWADRLQREQSLASIIDAFGVSQEFTSRYGGLGSEQLVRNLYLQLFGRQPDIGGLNYWVGEFESGKKTLQSIALDVLFGARNDDLRIIQNRNRVARHYLTLADRYPDTSLATESLLSNVYGREESAASACNYISALFGEPSPDNGAEYLSYTIGGQASGLQGVVTLVMDAGEQTELLQITGNGTFGFQQKLKRGSVYEVSIDKQPVGSTCVLHNGFGEVTDHDETGISLRCAPSSGAFSISGMIESAAAIDYDRDVNDPLAPYQANDKFGQAQPIDNRVTIHGFASKDGTFNFSDADRFTIFGDEFDVYTASLQKGQIVQMQIIDYDQFDIDSKYQGDLDLVIFDSNQEIVDGSFSDGEYELLVIPESGEYYVVVMAYSGISKYVLQLLPPSHGNQTAKSYTPVTNMDFVPNQMLLEREEGKFSAQAASLPVMSLSNQDTSRTTLAYIDREAGNQRRIAAAGQEHTPVFPDELKSLNSGSYDKLMTLIDIKRTARTAGVKLAEPNYRVHPMAVPNDDYYSYQWHYPQIQLPQAWDVTTGQTGEPVIVAVVDSGVFLDHPDLRTKLVPGYDFISDAAAARDGGGIDANPDDPGDSEERGQSSFHGTHVAGTVAAASNDGYGVAGVSWGAKIMPVRVLGVGGGTSYDTIQGVRYAAGLSNDSGRTPQKRADIINMSLGGGSPSITEQRNLDEVRAAGVIIVAAAGNSNTSELSYPASYDGVISVSAVDINSNLTPYSNFGQAIDVAAPGGDTSTDHNGDQYSDGVLSAVADDASGSRESAWVFMPGTSMASPHVAGVIALMKSVHPGLTPDQVDHLLSSGEITDDLGSRGWDSKFGHGLINAYKAVKAAQQLAGGSSTPVEPEPRLSVSPTSLALGQATVGSFTLGNQGGGVLGVESISTSETWLGVTPQQTDADGLGTYQVRVNRNGLAVGTHSATITISHSSGADYSLPVTLRVGELQTNGRVTKQYVLLLRADNYQYVTGALSSLQNGKQTFVIDNVPVGEYYLYSSSDIDHDYMPCVSGEVCGAYPNLQSRSIVQVLDAPLSNVRVVVNMLSGITDHSGLSWTTGPARELLKAPSKRVQ
ncbi:MAG: peptidase S8 and S53, subtilisin, kexin, sedolisin [Gammaproteobacteria bacterium]|nr:MAG: peptidase S8 and S53, subtilisin, kexin, sedolisin [Pseudomonadota bacterium]PIE38616.1 MAG: peptidase S8 and S53, subtilisin, kexin, sedolisin [Gammaproteobacteria bacterium]